MTLENYLLRDVMKYFCCWRNGCSTFILSENGSKTYCSCQAGARSMQLSGKCADSGDCAMYDCHAKIKNATFSELSYA